MRENESTGPARLLTLPEAAEWISVSLRTLQYLIRDGAIKKIRLSQRRVAVHPDDLAAYIASRRGKAE